MNVSAESLNTLLEQINAGHSAQALPELEQLLSQQPAHPGLLTLRAEALRLMGHLDAALEAFKHAGESGASPRNWLIAGVLLTNQRKIDEALSYLQRALAQSPDDQEVLDALITALFNSSRYREGVEFARRQLSVSHNPSLMARAALLLHANDLYEESTAAFKNIIALAPNEPAFAGSALIPTRFTCDWEAVEELQRRISDCYARGDFGSPQEYPLTNLTWCADEARNLGVTRAYVARMVPRAQQPVSRRAGSAGPRIRVGYLSCDFRNHATMHLMAGLLEAHDRRRFEVFAYDYSSHEVSEYRQRFLNAVEHHVPIHSLTDQQAAERIANDGVDILFDLKLYTGGGRAGILAYRPAPLQAAYLGFPGSAASADIDYIVSDRFVTPDSSAPYYTEKFCRLPHSYQCNDRRRFFEPKSGSRSSYGLPDGKIVFGAFNQSYKIDRGSFSVWLRILKEVPEGVLWMLGQSPAAVAHLTNHARLEGIDSNRIIFAPFAPPTDHLKRLPHADVFLDTLICNGHTTTSDALWAGVPVITVRGRHFASRVSESLLNAMDLSELVAHDQEEMVRIAKRIGMESSYRLQLREKVIANRQTTPLFDTARFARDFETGIELMVHRQRQGLPAAHIDVPDAGPLDSVRQSTTSDPVDTSPKARSAAADLSLERVHLKVINLKHRADRRQDCIRELSKVGTEAGDAVFFEAKSMPDLGALGCAMSHAKALADFLYFDEKPFALILEDDFSIRDPDTFSSTIDNFCNHENLWDVVLLGHNSAVPIEPTAFGTACRTVNAQTTSGYLVGRLYASKLIEYFFRSAELLRRYRHLPEPNRMIAKSIFSCDILWKELQTRDRFVVPIPALIIQRASYSNVENRHVDYGV